MRIASIIFVLLVFCSFATAQDWPGTYTTTISIADVPPEMKDAAGAWELILGEEGQFTTTQNGEVVVRGTYAVAGEQMTFSDAEGKMACLQDQASGVYTPTLDGGTLTFTLVDDKCSGRRIVLTSHSLTKKVSPD